VVLARSDVFGERNKKLVSANVVPSSLILVVLLMAAIGSSETLVLIRATRCHIREDGILRLKIFISEFTRAITFSYKENFGLSTNLTW
jgi:hypothetical protein